MAGFRWFASIVLVAAASAFGQKPFDWSQKWHGQKVAVAIISRGEALKGKHFDSKINRLQEGPWNAIQLLLGSYMIARLDEEAAKKIGTVKLERLAVESCAGVMTMLSTHQQLYEGHVVYQLDDWRQGDPQWREVWDAPMMASTIFHVTDEQTKQLSEICGYETRRIASPMYRSYSPGEEPSVTELAFSKPHTASELKALFGRSLEVLTADQRREAYNILGRFEKRFAAVARG